MKIKLLSLGLLLGATFVGCTNTETVENTSPEYIKFDANVGRSTKATPIGKSDIQTSGFRVTAISTGTDTWSVGGATNSPQSSNLFYNKQISYTAGENVWGYEPFVIWPNDHYVSFFAYAPYSNNVTLSAASVNGTPTLTYVNPNANADQVDLTADMITDRRKSDTNNKITYAFDHILSKIGFSAKLDKAYNVTELTSVTVTSVKVYFTANKVMNSRVYTFNASNQLTNWADLNTPTYHPAAADGSGDEVMTDSKVLALGGTTSLLTASNKYLMMIPQALASVGDMYVDITYTIVAGNTVTTTTRINLPAITWNPGKQYNYVLKITPATVVVEDVNVGDWTDDGSSEIDV